MFSYTGIGQSPSPESASSLRTLCLKARIDLIDPSCQWETRKWKERIGWLEKEIGYLLAAFFLLTTLRKFFHTCFPLRFWEQVTGEEVQAKLKKWISNQQARSGLVRRIDLSRKKKSGQNKFGLVGHFCLAFLRGIPLWPLLCSDQLIEGKKELALEKSDHFS